MRNPPQLSTGSEAKCRLDYAREQILEAVQTMDARSRYHVYTFADDVLIWNVAPVPPSPGTTRALADCLGQLHADGGTNLYGGLAEVLGVSRARLGEEAPASLDELFVLSDGQPTTGPSAQPLEILRIVRELNRYQKVRINTVFTGHGEGAALLRRLAEENDGVFVHR
jgi:hypothetical protein